jgi:N-acetylglutamate synthase-like GNAT family acetyltransferase
MLEDFKDYSVLSNLIVFNRYRGKGIGSVLVDRCINATEKPIYLFCYPKLTKFYQRFGFEEVDRDKEDRIKLRKLLNFNVRMMVFKKHSKIK